MIQWSVKKAFATVLTFLGIGTLTSCYGMAPNYAGVEGNLSGGKSEKTTVKGISVRALDSNGMELDQTYTQENGKYYLQTAALGSEVSVVFEDVDGEKNGSFKTQFKKICLDDVTNKLDVELEDADDEE